MRSSNEDAVEEHLIKLLAGTNVRVRVRGRGPHLLMINGIGGHIDMWAPLADELSRTRRLVLFDAPGSGASPPLPSWTRMPGLSDVVVQLLDELGISSTDVLGYSWGGALAQQLAHTHPSRVKRLVLVATVPGAGGKPPKLRVARAMLTPDRFKSAEQSRAWAGLIYGGDYRQQPGQWAWELPSSWHSLPPSMRGYGQQMFAITGWSSIPWLRRLPQQVLVISGADDPLVPRLNARILAGLLRRSELRLIPGAGHLWLLDHAPESAELIERFLQDA